MAWEHRLLRRGSSRFRSISLIVVVATGAVVFFLVGLWLRSPTGAITSQAETRAIQAALAQFVARYGHGPVGVSTIKTTKLEGTGWIVQITERASPEPGGLRVINTFHVGGDRSCQWLSVDEWGAY
jgi:hypothetical protein